VHALTFCANQAPTVWVSALDLNGTEVSHATSPQPPLFCKSNLLCLCRLFSQVAGLCLPKAYKGGIFAKETEYFRKPTA